MSFDINPFSKIETISTELLAQVDKSAEKSSTSKNVDELNDILNQVPVHDFIKDIAQHPEHQKVWDNIHQSLTKLDADKFKKIQEVVERLIHIGTALSKEADESIKVLDKDLKECTASLKEALGIKKGVPQEHEVKERESKERESKERGVSEKGIEDHLKFAGLILFNYMKLFGGKTVSGTDLTQEQRYKLLGVLNEFSKELKDISAKNSEISSLPLFKSLQVLTKKLGGKDILDIPKETLVTGKKETDAKEFSAAHFNFMPDELKVEILKMLPADVHSLSLIRELISHNPESGHSALAGWIDNHELSLSKFSLSAQELQGIQQHLRRVDFGLFDFATWTEKNIFDFIQNCSKMEMLVIHTPKITTFPDRIKQLKFLDCSYCTWLTVLPAMDKLEVLNCSRCAGLIQLPESLDVLRDFCCDYCPGLTRLPDMNDLRKLSCVECTDLTRLPEMPYLESLECEACPRLATLPNGMAALQILDCSGCSLLTALPADMPLSSLCCSSCNGLTGIPYLNTLKNLSCGDCPGLRKISQLESLEGLYCGDCRNLREISELKALKNLGCPDCPNLRELSALESLETIDCHNCENLTTLPPSKHLKELKCDHCPNLTIPPQYERLMKHMGDGFGPLLHHDGGAGFEYVDDV